MCVKWHYFKKKINEIFALSQNDEINMFLIINDNLLKKKICYVLYKILILLIMNTILNIKLVYMFWDLYY